MSPILSYCPRRNRSNVNNIFGGVLTEILNVESNESLLETSEKRLSMKFNEKASQQNILAFQSISIEEIKNRLESSKIHISNLNMNDAFVTGKISFDSSKSGRIPPHVLPVDVLKNYAVTQKIKISLFNPISDSKNQLVYFNYFFQESKNANAEIKPKGVTVIENSSVITKEVSFYPSFNERFPYISKSVNKIGQMSIDEAKDYLEYNQSISLSKKKAKFYDWEFEGEHIIFVGSIALILNLWYFTAHLTALFSHIQKGVNWGVDFQEVYPLWVGVQQNRFSKVLTFLSIFHIPIVLSSIRPVAAAQRAKFRFHSPAQTSKQSS